MNEYTLLSKKYLLAHKKKTNLIIVSVAISVALVVGIFSMLDSLIKFEKAQVLASEGNYHILIRDASMYEKDYINDRIEVKDSGTLYDYGEGSINGVKCWLGSLDKSFASNLNFNLLDGRYPENTNEVILEKWYMDNMDLTIGDTVGITSNNGVVSEYIVSGTYSDWGVTKANSIPIVFLSEKMYENWSPINSQFFILFKEGVDINSIENNIQKSLNLNNVRIAHNERLLALMMQTGNSTVLKMYFIGGVLFFLVLIAAVVMIYNTFNISVMDRVRHFGLLRCIGATPSQIRKLVRKEALYIAVKSIPTGVIMGIIMTFICTFILKTYNNKIFGGFSYFNFSSIGIYAGIILGLLTVFAASLVPAIKASNISPMNAVRGNSDLVISRKSKRGILARIFKIEYAVGISNALYKKKTLFLMSSSIAISIVLFLGFNVLINPKYLGMSPIKVYTPDISLRSETGFNEYDINKLKGIDNIKEIHGRMTGYAYVNFDGSKLTEIYKKTVGDIELAENGMLIESGYCGLISYDKKQLEWAKDYIVQGKVDENQLNQSGGVIAVSNVYIDNSLIKTTDFKVGDKIFVETFDGFKELIVLGVMEKVPDGLDQSTMTTFVTTEKIFSQINKPTPYNIIDIQLNDSYDDKSVDIIRENIESNVTLLDKRQFNMESNNAYLTVAIFIYGFIGVIVLISILNIINTMNTSVASKTRYLGIMRAVGMTGDQITKMVLAECLVYTLLGCAIGCTLGSILQKMILGFLLEQWVLPVKQILAVFIFTTGIASITVIRPLKKVKSSEITEVIRSL